LGNWEQRTGYDELRTVTDVVEKQEVLRHIA